MKKLRLILTLSMSICMLAACNNETPSNEKTSSETSSSETNSDESTPSKEEESSQKSTHTDVLYAVFSADNVKEYPIEYTGDKKNAEELSDELSELVGLDFTITTSKTDEGLIVDWAADSTLIAGLDGREQKKDFYFFDNVSLSWFMMDSLCRTLTENLHVENIYYTMDGGKELEINELYPVNKIPSDTPYMGSDFYFSHDDVKGDDEDKYARTNGLWRLDGATDTASIVMDGHGGFTMYYASGSVEATGYLECTDEFDDGNLRYDMYTAEDELITSFYFDSDTQIHIGNDDVTIYILDTQEENQQDYQGYWQYPDGQVLEIRGAIWYLYGDDGATPIAQGPVTYDESAAYLMNEDGSSGGGKVYFDENNNLICSGDVLTHIS